MPELAVVKSWPLPQFDPTPDEARTLAEIRTRESSGDYAARNPKPGSTAAGAYQFIGPTWQLATKGTGAPVYSSAAEAPQVIQDANALHMLRQYGPNSTTTWAASGPYKQPSNQGGAQRAAAQAPASQPAAGDVLSRIATGDVSPDELAQYLQPKQAAPAAAAPETSQASPAAPLTVVKSWPLPATPPAPSAIDEAKRLGSIAAGSSGLTVAKDTLAGGAKAAMDFLTGNPVNPQDVQQFKTGAGSILGGIAAEPERMRQQLIKSGDAMTRGDINEAANHLWYSLPFAGAAGEQMAEYLKRGDIKGAFAHAVGALIPVAAGPAAGATKAAIEAAPEVVEQAKVAVPGALKGAGQAAIETQPITIKGQTFHIPTVVAGGAGGGQAASMMGLPRWVGTVGGAAAPIVRGAVRGARTALEERAAAGAVEEAPAAAEVAAAPTVAPVTAPTDEALVHLYSVETDPAKRSALQAQLVDRGLMKGETGAPAPEANPYRGYSQDALQKVYAIEPDAAKRALIEQAAGDRNLTLLNREGRRATAAVPETGAPEARGPSLTQDDVLLLRYLGEADPLAADADTIGVARKLAADHPELLNRLRAGETEPIVAPTTPAGQAAAAPPAAAAPAQPAPAVAQPPAPSAPVPVQKPVTPPPAPAPPQAAADFMRSPGQAYAASEGYDWAKLSAQDRQLFEHIATAQENVATTPAPPTPAAGGPAPAAAPPAAQPSLSDFMSGAPATELESQLADSLRAAQEGKQAAAATTTEAPTPKPENVYVKNARLAKAVRVADAAEQLKITSRAAYDMITDEAKRQKFAEDAGEKSISSDTMAMVVDKLRRREADAARK